MDYLVFDQNAKKQIASLPFKNVEEKVSYLEYQNKLYGYVISIPYQSYTIYNTKGEKVTDVDSGYYQHYGETWNFEMEIIANVLYDVTDWHVIKDFNVEMPNNYYVTAETNNNYIYFVTCGNGTNGSTIIKDIYNNKGENMNIITSSLVYEMGTPAQIEITESGDIALKDGNVLKIYDKNGKLIKSSREYDKLLGIFDGYISLIENDYLKLYDYNDNEVASFVKMTDNLIYNAIDSGYYGENHKVKGIYLILTDTNLEYGTIGAGLEYYYGTETGETGVIKTEGIGGYAKPVLYLYPEKDNTKVTVSFENAELLTTTYPKYENAWEVVANSNGDLYDESGRYYYGLYWEESAAKKVDFSEGFYVEKEDALTFLEEKLAEIGLTQREANEFIMYWLPGLEQNAKSLVYFELTDSREEFNKLNIEPTPDSLLRVAIHIKKVNEKVNIKPQTFAKFERAGFTAVEWGGFKVN